MLPDGAKLEATLTDRVAVYDVSHLLPKHHQKKYLDRDVKLIDALFLHKSGADGKPGFAGALGMATFITEDWGRDWAGAPYQGWVSTVPDKAPDGRMVVYRTQRDDVRSFHTGGKANQFGVALCMQGAYDGQWDLLATGRPKIEVVPFAEAMVCWEAAVTYWRELYRIQLERVAGHFEGKRFGAAKNKSVCPGDHLRQWILDYRADTLKQDDTPTLEFVSSRPGEIVVGSPSIDDIQVALRLLGYNPGALDGIWGYRSRRALERFQEDFRLEVDGWYGPKTALALLGALRLRGFANEQVFRVHERRLRGQQ